MVVRHPAIVSLSPQVGPAASLGALLDPGYRPPDLREDAAFLHHLLVVKYERLVTEPQATLAEITTFLELDGEIPAAGIDTRRSATYERQWPELATGGPWRRERFRSLCRRHEEAANHSATASSTWTAPTRSRSAPPAPLSRSGRGRTIWPHRRIARGRR